MSSPTNRERQEGDANIRSNTESPYGPFGHGGLPGTGEMTTKDYESAARAQRSKQLKREMPVKPTRTR